MFVFLALLAGQTLATPATLRDAPSLEPLTWTTSFPREAFRQTPNHAIKVAITIGPDGKIARCDTLDTSGDSKVDGQICRSLTKEARFSPPKGPDGQGTFVQFESALTISATAPTNRLYPVIPLFRYTDYPPSSLRNGEQGAVGYEIEIGADGRVTHCAVPKSSGYPTLDQVTCQVITERAKFKPPVDMNGAPTTAHDSGTVRWVMP